MARTGTSATAFVWRADDNIVESCLSPLSSRDGTEALRFVLQAFHLLNYLLTLPLGVLTLSLCSVLQMQLQVSIEQFLRGFLSS